MEAKIEETNEESQLKEAANQKISFENVATLSMAVLNFVQGTKKQYWDHANIVAGLVDGVVPEEMERFLTKSQVPRPVRVARPVRFRSHGIERH